MAGDSRVEPIGVVHSPRTEPLDDDWDEIVSTVTLDAHRFDAEAVAGLDAFSHIEVVYVFDRVAPTEVQTGARRPRGNPAWPEVGIFAQRGKGRPNRIGVTVCQLLAVHGLDLTVRGLDAIDGTPVIDVKPYMREFGPRGPIRQPAWSHDLMAGYWTRPAATEARDAVRSSYDAVADRYTEAIGDELADKPFDRALLRALAEHVGGGTVADLGAGPGHVARSLRNLGVAAVAVDLASWMCRQAAAIGVPSTVGDLCALPLRSESLGGVVCWYAVIHLNVDDRRHAYREIARVLQPGGLAIVAFHTADDETRTGGARVLRQWHGQPVRLTFRFLDPVVEAGLASGAGLSVVGRFDRRPGATEHPSERTYLLLTKRSG